MHVQAIQLLVIGIPNTKYAINDLAIQQMVIHATALKYYQQTFSNAATEFRVNAL